MVEALDHGLAHNPLQLPQIHQHPAALVHEAADSDLEGVVVTVHLGETPEDLSVFLWAPLGAPVPVSRREGEAARRVDRSALGLFHRLVTASRNR